MGPRTRVEPANGSRRQLTDCIVLYRIVLYLSISIARLTASAFQKRSQIQQLPLCRSSHAEALQVTASEGLAQGPYAAAIEPDSNPRPSGQKASTLPMCHHVAQRQ